MPSLGKKMEVRKCKNRALYFLTSIFLPKTSPPADFLKTWPVPLSRNKA